MRSKPAWILVVKWSLVCVLASGVILGLSAMTQLLDTGRMPDFSLRAAMALFFVGVIGLMLILAYIEMRYPIAARNPMNKDTHPVPGGDFGGTYAPDFSASSIADHEDGDAGGDGGGDAGGDGGGDGGGGGDG